VSTQPKTDKSTRRFIWLFGGLLVLLTGYQLLRHQPQRFEPPPGTTSDDMGRYDSGPPTNSSDLVEVPPPAPADLPVEEKVYTYVEQMPQPPGGMEGLMQYLRQNLRYPASAERNGVEGKVFVQFVVRTDGRISDVTVTKGIGAGCDEEAIRLIQTMPTWAPGKQNGRAVNVSYTVPVTFTRR
jgi:TonB family protein